MDWECSNKKHIPEFSKKDDFPERPLSVGPVPEGVEDLLDGDDASGTPRSRLPDDAVRALAEPLVDLVLQDQPVVDFSRLA